jgi:hypothetical protein
MRGMNKYLFFICFSIFIAFTGIPKCFAQTSYESLQSAYIYNFAKYIKWNPIPDPFIIGIYGHTDLTPELEKLLTGRKINGKDIVIKPCNSIDQTVTCNIVYLPKSKNKEFEHLKTTLSGKNILLVTESDQASNGAGISFIMSDNKLKFKLNLTALKKSGIEATEGLLKLAIVVQ